MIHIENKIVCSDCGSDSELFQTLERMSSGYAYYYILCSACIEKRNNVQEEIGDSDENKHK